jgi:two-component system sensor histidine kinase/response regulator
MHENRGNILVVDDTPDNLRLLAIMLSGQGYTVRKALNGQIALNTIRQIPPDLILIDINMPGMNGYELCGILKQDKLTQDIPLIFISALNDVLDKVKAFQAGGSDYITKPFQGEEVCARIEQQLTIQRQKKQLQQEISDRQKTEEALQVYLHAVSHDLRNPVLGMSLVLRGLLKQSPSEAASIPIPFSILDRMKNSCDRQLQLINSLIDAQQFERGGVSLNLQPVALYALSQQLIADWQPLLKQHKIKVINDISQDLPSVQADSHQLWRVFENLLGNAIKHNPPGIKISLSASIIEPNLGLAPASPPFIRCVIQDSGVGINPAESEALFERYQRGKGAKNRPGLGLGLYLCRQIVEAHGGKMGVTQAPDQGTAFWFTLVQIER